MRNFYCVFLLIATALFWGSCKKDKVDDCVKNFVGNWDADFNENYFGGGGCSSSLILDISETSGCGIKFSNMPYKCNSNDPLQVLGTVSGDSFFVATQPFGAETISGSGRVYLNQLYFTGGLSDGATIEIIATK